MAGRLTINAGPNPVILTGLDASNSTPAYLDAARAAPIPLPLTIPAGAARILYVEDGTITPTVTSTAGVVLSATATACRAGSPVILGPFDAVSSDQIPPGTILRADLEPPVQDDLTAGATAYQLPGTGIPAADLAAAVQTSLGLADSATQSADLTAAIEAERTSERAHQSDTYAPYDGVIAALAGGDVPAAPAFTRMARGLFTQAASGLDSLYSPWIIRVDDKLGSPLGRFYLYFSTNHALDAGGIGLAYADDPAGPWTVHPSNPVYVDTTANYQTENVSVIWDSDNDRFIGYYKADNTGLHTYAMTSPDGVAWTRVGQVITRPTNTPGDGLTGYFRPFRDGAMWRAYHLVGGGNLCYMAMSHSYDGLSWKTDPRPLMYDVDISGSNTRRIDWHGSTPVRYKGQLWLLGTLSDFTSGGTTGYPTQFVCPLSADHRTPLAPPITVASTLLSGETTPDSFGNAIFYNGALYTYYVSDGSTSPTAGGTGGGTMAYARGI